MFILRHMPKKKKKKKKKKSRLISPISTVLVMS